MDYAGFLRSQWQTLLDQWLGKNETAGINVAYIALPDISWIDRLCRPYQPGGGGKWVPLGSVPSSEALVRLDGRGGRELWVRPEEKAGGAGRYAAYWRAFADTCGYEAVEQVVAGRKLAVDHLFPETAAARRAFALVRVMPVDLRSNSLVGGSIERVEAGREGAHRPRTASSVTLAKVTGFQGSFSRKNDPAAVARALLAHIRACGLVISPDAIPDMATEIGNIASLIDHYRK